MCTVTVIPLRDAGFRLVTNRDERRERPPALPPQRFDVDGAAGAAIWPIDPTGGGTWVGVNDLGVAASTLNYNERPDGAGLRPMPARSRGTIIPAILGEASAVEAADVLRAMEFGGMLPFRVIVVDEREAWIAVWNGVDFAMERSGAGPICLVSSGLGDALVAPRLGLFQREVVMPGPNAARQDAYHAHRWPDRPEISVDMERAAARTVSRTVVEVARATVSVRYAPIDGAAALMEMDRSMSRSGAPG